MVLEILLGTDQLCDRRIATIRSDDDTRADLGALAIAILGDDTDDTLTFAQHIDNALTEAQLGTRFARPLDENVIELVAARAQSTDGRVKARRLVFDRLDERMHWRRELANAIAKAKLVENLHAVWLDEVRRQRLIARKRCRVDDRHPFASEGQEPRKRRTCAPRTHDHCVQHRPSTMLAERRSCQPTDEC